MMAQEVALFCDYGVFFIILDTDDQSATKS